MPAVLTKLRRESSISPGDGNGFWDGSGVRFEDGVGEESLSCFSSSEAVSVQMVELMDDLGEWGDTCSYRTTRKSMLTNEPVKKMHVKK
jgi:hypothetical protein